MATCPSRSSRCARWWAWSSARLRGDGSGPDRPPRVDPARGPDVHRDLDLRLDADVRAEPRDVLPDGPGGGRDAADRVRPARGDDPGPPSQLADGADRRRRRRRLCPHEPARVMAGAAVRVARDVAPRADDRRAADPADPLYP